MIDKYKLLYSKIKELQEERKKAQEKQRAESSINPFSIASAAKDNFSSQKK